MKGFGLFKNLKIGARIYTGFAVILVLLCVVSGIGIVSLMNDSLTQYSNTASNALRVASIDTDFISMRRQVLVFSGSGDQKIAARIQEMGAKLLKDTNAVLATEADPERKATLQKVVDGVETISAISIRPSNRAQCGTN